MNLYYEVGDQQIGPIGKRELQSLVKAKKLNARTRVREEGKEDWEDLRSFVQRKLRDKPQTDSLAPQIHQEVCSECGKDYNQSDMIRIDNALVCAGCKPLVLQKIKEGVKIGAGSRLKDYGSLEKGLQGNYDLSVSDLISEAWQMTKGSKLVIVGSFLLVWIIGTVMQNVISLPLSFLIGFIAAFFENIGVKPESKALIVAAVGLTGAFTAILSSVVQAPLWAGLEMIGVRRSVDSHISCRLVFNYFKQFVPLALTWLLITFCTMVGFLFFILPGIYLAVASMLSIQLVADKKLGPWQAFKSSVKAISHKWFHVFWLFIVLGFLVMISAIPLGIGLIWTGPLFIVAKGVLYRNVFGVDEAT